MDLILHDYNLNDIETQIKEALEMSDNKTQDIAFRLGFSIGALKCIQATLDTVKDNESDVIGRTVVTWLPQDIKAEFQNRYDREPSDDEVKDIIDNYLMDMNDRGEECATEAGWNVIYDALDDWEKDNPQEEIDG